VAKSSVARSSVFPAEAPQEEQKRTLLESSVPQEAHLAIIFSRYSLTRQNGTVRRDFFDSETESLKSFLALPMPSPKREGLRQREDFLMRTRFVSMLLVILLLASCNSTTHVAPPAVAARVYQGTASVGEFLTITIDSSAQTNSYTDVSNGDSGTVPYTVNADDTYALNDPKGNLLAAYEVPSYVVLIQAAKTGANRDTPALITAVTSGSISMSTFAAHAYNYMQFRTAAGGLEVGSVAITTQGIGTISSFWPYGSYNQGNQSGSPFHTGMIDMTQAQVDASGTFLKVPEMGGNGFDYVFGTANGVFAVDTGNGAILGLRKAASKNFDPSFAGFYKAIFYQKTKARTGAGNVETGTANLGHASLTVDGNGYVVVSDAQGTTIMEASLTPVADATYLYGSAGQLQDPCNGVFTFRLTSPSAQQDVFVTFMDKAMLFSSFTANLPWAQGSTYDYLYGVALK
jgi:hypothetical protein